jgi:hypothetical protein
VAPKGPGPDVRREYQRGFRDMLFDLHRKHSRAKLKTARRQAIREHRAGRRDEPRGPSAETPFGRQRLDSSARRLVRRRQEIVLAILVNHPTLIEEFDEILDLFVFDPDLDKLRAALQNLALAGHALDLEGLTHHLISSGADGPLHDVTTPAIYALAPQARPGADVSEARILLEHVLLIRQQDVLMGEYQTAGRDPDGVSDGDARDARLGALRRTVDDGEGRLAADLDWDDNG